MEKGDRYIASVTNGTTTITLPKAGMKRGETLIFMGHSNTGKSRIFEYEMYQSLQYYYNKWIYAIDGVG